MTTTMTTKTTVPEARNFSTMQAAGEYAGSLRRSGFYVEIIDIAEGLSGDEYAAVTREYRWIVKAREFVVGDGATTCGWSDRHAGTVIARTAKTMKIQYDKATLLNGPDSGEKDALKFSPGGFVGHTEWTPALLVRARPRRPDLYRPVDEERLEGYRWATDYRRPKRALRFQFLTPGRPVRRPSLRGGRADPQPLSQNDELTLVSRRQAGAAHGRRSLLRSPACRVARALPAAGIKAGRRFVREVRG
jgi:hypothetical protein